MTIVNVIFMNSGMCNVVNKISALLACYAMYIGCYLPSLERWTIDDGPDTLSRKVAKQLPVYSAYNHRRAEISTLNPSVRYVAF